MISFHKRIVKENSEEIRQDCLWNTWNNLGKISAQPHTSLCIQFLDRENSDKNNTLPLGKQICFRIVWGCAEIITITCSNLLEYLVWIKISFFSSSCICFYLRFYEYFFYYRKQWTSYCSSFFATNRRQNVSFKLEILHAHEDWVEELWVVNKEEGWISIALPNN